MNPNPKPDSQSPEHLIASSEVLIRDLLKGIIRSPDNLEIETKRLDQMVVMQINPEQVNVPMVIGRGGKRLESLRILFGQIFKLRGLEFDLIIKDKIDRSNRPPPKRDFGFSMDQRAGRTKCVQDYKSILERTVKLLIIPGGKYEVTFAEMPPDYAMFNIKVDPRSLPDVMGPTIQFIYGPDGAVFGSIKSLGDAFGKASAVSFRFSLGAFPAAL